VLFPDDPASGLTLHRDRFAYARDNGLGAMVVHFHDAVGNKTQIVQLKDRVGMMMMVNRYAKRGDQVPVSVEIMTNGGAGATGPVVLKEGTTTLASGTAVNGLATLTLVPPTPGTHVIHAEYAGDANYEPVASDPWVMEIAKTDPHVTLQLSRTVVRRGMRMRATVRVPTVAGVAPTGVVTILKNGGPTFGKVRLVNGVAVLTWRNRISRTFNMYLSYSGDANYGQKTSNVVHVKVRR
jgi:hypothetical protein